ncbi:B-cell linker protein isoform X2 [Gadus morhua]|uniref:B-cell linker protein isoform X2 n=1 Tax=Gadus morhua TaxID=8049 RepID=UPI0011B7ED74|nr:B-cell linker protein-like isoform X2 [Gadus morhua]
MEQFSRFAAPATSKLRQLQKIVQDISNNEDSLLNKWRRHRDKHGPKVPDRDYPVSQQIHTGGGASWSSRMVSHTSFGNMDHFEDTERWSDESDYEEPPDADGYEDPPAHQVFTPSSSACFSRDNYVDSCRRPSSRLSRKPWTSTTTKPLPPEPCPAAGDNEDYIDPERSIRDNNIKPAAKPLQGVNSSPVVSKPLRKLPCSPVVYEVTLPEENIPPVSRQTQPLQTKLSTRLISPRVILEQSDTEFEAFDPDISQTIPKMSRGHPPPPKAFTADFRPPMIPLPQKPYSRRQADLSLMVANGLQDMDEKSDIDRQPWYANTCGRKTAEELLIQSNRDGSFLVRRSTGQDPQQPYTLVVLYKGRVYNIPVRFIQATQHYALGREKRGQQHFSSVSKIIENHLQNPLVLIDNHSNSRDITKLRHPVRSQVVPQR